MENYSICLPAYSIGTEVYNKIEHICRPYGKRIVAIGGHRAMKAVEAKLTEALKGTQLILEEFRWYGGECSFVNVERLMLEQTVKEADMIFAIGGGKALDTGKCLGEKMQKPVFTFPTIASNCACCTSVSIMYHEDGSFFRPDFFEKPAVHAFINTEVIVQAPYKYLWAGMGDTYAKYYEASISSRGEELVHYLELGVKTARMCVDPILKYGTKALADNKKMVASEEFKETILAVMVTTGIASILLTAEHTADYNSGLAHAIFYALTTVPNFEKEHLHGEIVGYGVLVMLLYDSLINNDQHGSLAEYEKIKKFNESVNLPIAIKTLKIDDMQLEKVVEIAITQNDISHFPYEVTKEQLLNVIKQMNNY